MKNARHNAAPSTLIDVRQATTDQGARMYAESLADANALTKDAVKPLTVDVPTAVGTIEAAYPGVYALRTELVALPGFPAAAIDKLPQYTLALGNADARYAGTTTVPGSLAVYLTEGSALRDLLFTQMETFAQFGLFEPAQVATMHTGTSFRAVGRDLQTLTFAFRDNAARIEGKSLVTEAQLARGAYLGEQINALVAFKEQQPAQISAAAEMRRRMFTLVDNAWDQIRRGVTYVRWNEGDLDEIAPSIHGHANAGRKPGAANEPNGVSEPSAPVVAAPAAGVPAALTADSGMHPVPKSNPFSAS